ncbi:MAG TPA: chemotaxis protein CheX [Terriglobales bacterium]|nr:chemotaxis protein CheX [Terriglobales bacterium]
MPLTNRPACQVREDWGPILESATREVFGMMLGSDLEPVVEPASRPGEVTAVVGLAGELCGAFIVRCTVRAALSMTSAMLGIDEEAVTDQAWDAVGEVCNMTAGNFKAKLGGIGDRCMLSVPTIVSGADYTVRSLADGSATQRDFLFRGERVSVCVEIHM